MIFHLYKIFCITDNRYEYVWKESTEAPPTTCPVDTSHSVDLESVAIEKTEDNSVKSVEVTSQSEPEPFAKPSYRTKWDASPDVITMSESQTTIMDLEMTEERYAHGGSVVFEGAKVGDWLEAEVRDDLGVIPLEYRAELCEDWPIVAKYISKYYLPPGTGECVMSTYPLNAKMTVGLKFRVSVHTCTEPGARKFATNYYLTKKL